MPWKSKASRCQTPSNLKIILPSLLKSNNISGRNFWIYKNNSNLVRTRPDLWLSRAFIIWFLTQHIQLPTPSITFTQLIIGILNFTIIHEWLCFISNILVLIHYGAAGTGKMQFVKLECLEIFREKRMFDHFLVFQPLWTWTDDLKTHTYTAIIFTSNFKAFTQSLDHALYDCLDDKNFQLFISYSSFHTIISESFNKLIEINSFPSNCKNLTIL